MKKSSRELKRLAREHLNGKYALPIGALLVFSIGFTIVDGIISSVVNPYASILNAIIYYIILLVLDLIINVFMAGFARIHLKIARKETPVFSDLFYGFKSKPDRYILASLFFLLIIHVLMIPYEICDFYLMYHESDAITILSLVFLIVAMVGRILVLLPYTHVLRLLADNPEMGPADSLKMSRQLMKGHKGRMFYIYLSFIGWTFLSIFTCFIGYLWVQPYMLQTETEFYRDLIGELDAPPEMESEITEEQ